MKILLFVVNDAAFLLSHRQDLVLAAQAAGYTVQVVCPPTDTDFIPGVTYHPWLVTRQGLHPASELRALIQLIRIYRHIKPHIVHHLTIKPVIYGSIAATLTRVPILVNAVTGLGSVYIGSSIFKKIIRTMINRAYQLVRWHPNLYFIFQNTSDQQYFIQHHIIRAQQSSVIPGSGVCMRHYNVLAMPSDAAPMTIVLAARMLKEKGISEFVSAAAALRISEKTSPVLRLILVGDVDPGNPGSLRRSDIQSWVEAGLVEWWGYQSDIRSVFAQAHIVCLPSYYPEGSPRVLIEACACARPIITTDTPGCRELVPSVKNGLLIPPRDVSALIAAIQILSKKSPEALASMGIAGRALVFHAYAKEHVIQQTLEIYTMLDSQLHSPIRSSTRSAKK